MADDVYYCGNCGGIMEFDVKSQKLKCPNCDTEITIQDDKSKIVEHDFNHRVAKKITVAEKTSETKQCKGCGAKVEISKDCTATQCPYCGSSYVLADKQEDAIVPDGVIPFKIDKHEAGERFTKWIGKRWLAPNTLKQLYESDKIQGVYVPYWTFDADVDCTYTAEGGKHKKVEVKKSDGTTETKTETDWYPTSGRVSKFFDDVLVKASKNMSASLLKGVEPYDTKKELSSYSPQYLSGYGAECYTISVEDAHKEATNRMESELKSMASSDVRSRYDEVRNVRIDPNYKKESYKHVLLPVYSTAYSYRNKNYNVLINGQSGKISGDYPKSPVKIAIIIAIIAAIIAGIVALSSGKSDKKEDKKDVGYNATYIENVVDGQIVEEIDVIDEMILNIEDKNEI